jgi:hypothetical protein
MELFVPASPPQDPQVQVVSLQCNSLFKHLNELKITILPPDCSATMAGLDTIHPLGAGLKAGMLFRLPLDE